MRGLTYSQAPACSNSAMYTIAGSCSTSVRNFASASRSASSASSRSVTSRATPSTAGLPW